VFLLATFVLGAIAFAVGIDKYRGAERCPWMAQQTFEKCRVRQGVAIVAIALDAGVFVGALISLILLAWYNGTGDWKLLRTGWRERERDAETEVVARTEGAAKFLRKVRPVRITVLSGVLLWTLGCVGVLTVFIILLHMDYQHDYVTNKYGRDLNEQPGWAARNTRLRYSATITGIATVLLNLIPFTHRAIAYIFALLYLLVAIRALIAFGIDIGEMRRAHFLDCPIHAHCRDDQYMATVILDILVGLACLFYVLYEYIAKAFTVSRWSGRNYCPHEIYKHDTKLDSMRPVRCELTGHVMTAKEYVYRYRFIAGCSEPVMMAPAPIGIMAPPVLV
jgi:hypothetical protein